MTNNYSSVTNSIASGTQTGVYPQQNITQPQAVQTQVVPQQSYDGVQYSQPQYAAPTVPVPTANGVNIVVYNPQVTPNANVSNVHNYPTNAQTYPQNYYTTQPAQQVAQQPIAAAKLEDSKPKEVKTKEIVQLSDDYLKTLESYLDNQDYKIRAMGVKELINRFAEDETRKNDIGLTALLNKALQDPKDSIRFMAMTILNSGYANGDELTQKLLHNIRVNNGAYGDDNIVAAEVQLKNAGTKIKVPDTSEPKKDSNGDKK